MEVKITLKADRDGEFNGSKRTVEANNVDFESVFQALLDKWREIDYQRSTASFQRAIVQIANGCLERPHLGWKLVMEPKNDPKFKP